jgi:all-trans-retinol 13,14-reductase
MDLVFSVSKNANGYFAQKAMPEALVSGNLEQMCGAFFVHSDQTTLDALRNLTSDAELIAVLCANWGDYSSPPHRSSFAMHCMLNRHYMDGGSYPVGGAKVLADAMMPIVEAAGGLVYHSAAVDQILIEDGRAIGVQLKGGELVKAKYVVSNAGVQNTFGRLMDRETGAHAGLTEKLEMVDDTYALVGVNIGLNKSASELGITPANIWSHPADDFEANLAAHDADFESPFPWSFITFPSARDPLWESEHPDKATIEMYAYTNYEHFRKWSGTRWMKRGDDYLARKVNIKDRLLSELNRFVPKAKEAIDIVEVSTPLSYETFVKRKRGGFMGVESTPTRFRQDWLRATTPIDGLYLSGQDVTTDGVVGALMGGVICASAIEGKNLIESIRSKA